MIYLLLTPSCSGCVKAKKFFNRKNIAFEEINFFKQAIPTKLLLDILQMTKDGVYDIISTRSKYLIKNKIDIDLLSIKELIHLISNVPSILKRPIIIQYGTSVQPKRLIIGYNEDAIQVFARELSIETLPEGVYRSVKLPFSSASSIRSDELQSHRERVNEFISTLNLTEIDDATLVALLYQQLPNSNAIKKLYFDYLLNNDPLAVFLKNENFTTGGKEKNRVITKKVVELNTNQKMKK